MAAPDPSRTTFLPGRGAETLALDRADPFRRLPSAAFGILSEGDPARLLARAADELQRAARSDAIRLCELEEEGLVVRVERGFDWRIADVARELDARLSERALSEGRSLISSHRRLDRDLWPLADSARANGVAVMALLLRAQGETHAVASLYWVGRSPPDHEALRPLFYLCDFVGLAVAGSRWRLRALEHQARLERLAFVDALTGLPNGLALAEELGRHDRLGTSPLSILHVDFDGLREANNNLGYEEGGDALIQAVGRSLPGLLREGEFAARAHSAGDEFVCVLPAVGEAEVAARALGLEHGLAQIALPPSLHAYYRGASVGGVTASGESAQELLARAAKVMRLRKEERAAARLAGGGQEAHRHL